MKRLNKPIITKETIAAMEDMSFFTHTLVFDDLLIIAQKETTCFVLKTSEGLIIIDAVWPDEKAFVSIVDAIYDVGWDAETLKKLVLTHGHADHTGCGKWLVDAYCVETYLSMVDDVYWKEHPVKSDRPDTWKDYEVDVYVEDGDVITLGDKSIYVFGTPGHTPGGLSYIFPVSESGELHMAALWGGATPPRYEEGVVQYLHSLEYFMDVAKRMNVDVALSNHVAFDNGLERIEYAKKRMSYMPNIYVIGVDGFRKYCEVFKTMGLDALKSLL